MEPEFPLLHDAVINCNVTRLHCLTTAVLAVQDAIAILGLFRSLKRGIHVTTKWQKMGVPGRWAEGSALRRAGRPVQRGGAKECGQAGCWGPTGKGGGRSGKSSVSCITTGQGYPSTGQRGGDVSMGLPSGMARTPGGDS